MNGIKMKLVFGFALLVAILFFGVGAFSYAQDLLNVTCVPNVLKQGGACLVTVSGPGSLVSVDGEFLGSKFPMAPGSRKGVFRGLLGIDMQTSPGTHELRAFARDADRKSLTKISSVKVEKVDFAVQRLTLPRSMVDLDPETLERVREETRRVSAVLKGYRAERLWNGPFGRPVGGEVSTPFGVRRVLNGQERSPHTGVDLRAAEGTPVRVCNRGIVALVDELFFSGNSVVLDHGWGMYSMYFHLSEVLVQEGETVERGSVLGLAGSTGRATGPHLHWGVKINGARVDPLSLIELSQYLEE